MIISNIFNHTPSKTLVAECMGTPLQLVPISLTCNNVAFLSMLNTAYMCDKYFERNIRVNQCFEFDSLLGLERKLEHSHVPSPTKYWRGSYKD